MTRPAMTRAVILGALFLTPAAARADNWPQWRGPNQDGISKETNLPAEWGEGKNILWKLSMPGMGGSTPAIWNDRIFLTSEEGSDLVLLCVSTEGKELWKRKLGTGRMRFMGGEGNGASASPSTDGKLVFTYIGTGDMACFDVDGNELWKLNAQERYGRFRIQHGMHVTPLLHGDRLYLSLLHSGGWWVIALDKATGKEVWKIERMTDARSECKEAYVSPILWHNDKDEYLIVHGNDYTTAHRLADGSEIWRLGDQNPKEKYHPTLRYVATPVATADLIVIPTAKNGPVFAVKPDVKGTISAAGADVAWRYGRTPDVPCPLVHDGLVYLNPDGMLICLDAKTGKEHYQQRIHSGRYRASPVYADGKVYCTARDGTVTVVKAGPKFEKLAENKVPDQTSASPAISNGRIYLRGWEALYVIGQATK